MCESITHMSKMRNVSHTHPNTDDANSVWERGTAPADD